MSDPGAFCNDIGVQETSAETNTASKQSLSRSIAWLYGVRHFCGAIRRIDHPLSQSLQWQLVCPSVAPGCFLAPAVLFSPDIGKSRRDAPRVAVALLVTVVDSITRSPTQLRSAWKVLCQRTSAPCEVFQSEAQATRHRFPQLVRRRSTGSRPQRAR